MKTLKTLTLPMLALGLAAFALAGQFAAPVAADTPRTDGVPQTAPPPAPAGAVSVASWQETDFGNPTAGQTHPPRR